jgi:hypothetical protein
MKAAMDAFSKSLRNAEHTRRFSISSTREGWEVKEERDGRVSRQVHYQDWHRVERARRSLNVELENLRDAGWSES